ncbi:type II toxin-antitoxin system RelE/ParE family toxin [Rhizobium sp. SGZ-381]|uniref:type II toxin-antitoxin system RelE/ParE family toxin n=1 Tax=Rhizobium sp. SGZ-381 TaxID=3342800 RepID=UPI00366F1447
MKSRRLFWTETARADLASAHRYISQDNEKAADRLILDLEAKARALAKSGLSGRDRSELGPNIRSVVHRSRILFFHVTKDAIVILRVLHGHQQLSSDLFPQEQQQD